MILLSCQRFILLDKWYAGVALVRRCRLGGGDPTPKAIPCLAQAHPLRVLLVLTSAFTYRSFDVGGAFGRGSRSDLLGGAWLNNSRGLGRQTVFLLHQWLLVDSGGVDIDR